MNKVNGHFYIGQSTRIERRFMEHFTPHNINNKNTVLSRAFKKYGKDNFSLQILEICNPEMLDQLEIKYIERLNPHYNMNEGGVGNKGHYVSEEMKEKFSEIGRKTWAGFPTEIKEKIIKNLSGPRIGHPVSQKAREISSKVHKGKPLSAEHRSKISNALKGKKTFPDSDQRLLGNANTVPSRTPADGQRWVMVLRLV